MSKQRDGGRLGIYVDAVYRVSPSPTGPIVSSDRAFLLFAYEVGCNFDELVLIGRTVETDEPADYVIPGHVELESLPHYANLLRLGQVARAVPGTLAGMWRGVGRVDTVWVIGPNPFDVILIALAALRRRRIALGVRQDTLQYYRSRVPSRLWAPALAGMWLVDALYRALARRAPTAVVGTAVARRYGLGRPTVLPMTVALLRDAQVAEHAPERDYSSRIELLTVGRLEREKNPLLLVEALSALEQRSPGRYRLTWVGRGPLESRIHERAAELGVDHLIELRGYVPFGEELFDLYRRSHVFVHVSLTEGVPQVIVEALALGTPVVATDVGGVSDAVGGGEAALLVPPEDVEALVAAVERMVADGNIRERLVAAGLERARRTTLEAEAARVARFIGRRAGPATTPASP